MQRYIDILPYRDPSGGDTVLIHIWIILIYRYIDVLLCIDIKNIKLYLYVQYFITDAMVVYYGCQSVTI